MRASFRSVTSNVAVIGDVGGHRDELESALIDLEWDPETGRLPPGLVVVQVGDLVHRGPDSTGVLDLVERVMDANPNQWVQLIGNHEGHYLGGLDFQPRQHQISLADQVRLRRWRREGRLHVAAAIEVDGVGEMLVTHAGLTAGMWRRTGSHASARETAQILNLMFVQGHASLHYPGAMVQDYPTTFSAGPVWAHPTKEVLASWLELGDMPFHQVHGHATEFRWRDGRWDNDVPVELRQPDAVDRQRRHTRLTVGSHVLMGIDPGHGRDGALRWAPLELESASVSEPLPLDRTFDRLRAAPADSDDALGL